MRVRLRKSKEQQTEKVISPPNAERTGISRPAQGVPLVLQLQRQYGNRYTQQVLATAREAIQAQPDATWIQRTPRTVTSREDRRVIPIPDDLRVSTRARISASGSFPNYRVVIIEPAPPGWLSTLLGAVGAGVAGGGTSRLLRRRWGLGRIAAWLATRPLAAIGAGVATFLTPRRVASERFVRRTFDDGMRVTYVIIR